MRFSVVTNVYDVSTSTPINLLGVSRAGLTEMLVRYGQQPYRAQQLMKWIYHSRIIDVHEMTNLSKSFRQTLDRDTCMTLPDVLSRTDSFDGTVKWVMSTSVGGAIECVLIPDGRRNTLCISSQVGCALDCSFCATGKQGFAGNLSTADIVGQVLQVVDWLKTQPDRGGLTNVVFMGMGEPLLNFEAVMDAADIFVDDMAFGISKRRVTISTAGVVPYILKMRGRIDVSLAVSLHAPNDELRSKLVPVNKKYPLARLMEACRAYLNSLGDRRVITFEYTLIDGVNDDLALTDELQSLLKGIRCKVNLIPFNSFAGTDYVRPSPENVKRFQRALIDRGLMTTCRVTRGDQIDAACGQLVGQFTDKTRRRAGYTRRLSRVDLNPVVAQVTNT